MNAPVARPVRTRMPGSRHVARAALLTLVAALRIAGEARAQARAETETTRVPRIVSYDPRFDRLVPAATRIETIATGFHWVEGPVWVAPSPGEAAQNGALLFSDIPANAVIEWHEQRGTRVFLEKAGYSGHAPFEGREHGSNGLTLDAEGRLTVAEHGNHRITRIERNGTVQVLADAYNGKRLNSPNDLVHRSDGTLYFTDPPFGLPRFYEDPGKELPYSGVFMLRDGVLTLVSKDLVGPNGLAFSPDERFLYVANWDPARKIIMRYDVAADGSLSNGRVCFDMTGAPGEEALDGLKVDQQGNLYVSGPGGMWILAPDARHLGTIRGPELAANFAWGDDDGRTLYMTARTGLYRIRLNVPGIRPPLRVAGQP